MTYDTILYAFLGIAIFLIAVSIVLTTLQKFTDRINNSLFEKIISSFIVIGGTKHIVVGICYASRQIHIYQVKILFQSHYKTFKN